jgi:pimeloyl-ACP methyl ester carboxylesterase
MLSSLVDSLLARHAARGSRQTVAGATRVHDSGGNKPRVVLVPDGPNVVAHYRQLIPQLEGSFRVVCFDMPGFGYSLPSRRYDHSRDQGAAAVIAVLDALEITKATLAFSCANGFYAIRVAQLQPHRATGLVLSQTPSLASMHAWSHRVVPWVLHVPVLGQSPGGCCGAGQSNPGTGSRLTQRQGSRRAPAACPGSALLRCVLQLCGRGSRSRQGRWVAAARGYGPVHPAVGTLDRPHRQTDPNSLKDLVPHATIVEFEASGHFPDLEHPERFAGILRLLMPTDCSTWP